MKRRTSRLNMRKPNLVIMILTLTAIINWHDDAFGQQPQDKCSQIRYSTPQINLKSFRLNRIEGQAVYASSSQKWELGSGNGVCVTLFDKRNSKFVANVTTDSKGQFEFAGIARGKYVLIAAAGDLQKIIIPVKLLPPAKAASHKDCSCICEKKRTSAKATLRELPTWRRGKSCLRWLSKIN
jgi:hypothetical protein